MGYPIDVALRYLGSKKRAFISVGTAFAILGVTLGVAALATVMSVTGGFQAKFREKVLGVNAHVLVLKYSTDFREYRTIMEQVAKVPGVEGTAPFSINPMMLTHGDATATGVLLKGVDPEKSIGIGAPPGQKPVLILPQQIVGCEEAAKQSLEAGIACGQSKLTGLRLPSAKPAARRVHEGRGSSFDEFPEPPTTPPPGITDGGALDEIELDDAGRNLRLIRALEDDIRRRDQEKDAGHAEGKPAPTTAPETDATDDEGPADAGAGPRGEIMPDGGYKSVLPDDDATLPLDVDPDPCANPAKVSQLPGIVVGVTLAKILSLDIGDCVTVTSPTIGYSFSGGALKPPVARRYRVIALFQAGFDQYDSKLVYTDLYEAQTFYDQGDTVTGIEMIVDDIDKAPKISRTIADMLGSGLYHTMDWEELNHGLFTALLIQQIGMSFVLALIILVAAFTVIATLVMVVLDKKKEIAVMKAMGATDGAILRIFLYQGGIIGFVGAAGGLLLGLLVCKGLLVYGFPLDPKVYFISRLPVQVRIQDFLMTGEIALAICLEATILPSLYAANLSPAEGFRDQEGSSDGPRQRGWALTIWLFLVHYGSTLLTLLGLLLLQSGSGEALFPRWSVASLIGIGALGSVASLAVLLWRRWGYYMLLFCFAALVVVEVVVLKHSRFGLSTYALSVLLARMTIEATITTLGVRRLWRFMA